jgi:hypothetical protein
MTETTTDESHESTPINEIVEDGQIDEVNLQAVDNAIQTARSSSSLESVVDAAPKLLACDQCTQTFSTQMHLISHVVTEHDRDDKRENCATPTKKYQCETCFQQFAKKQGLQRFTY